MKHPRNDLYSAPLNGRWMKSSYSNGSGSDCVQLMRIAGGVAIGDSKCPEAEPLRCTDAELRSLLDHLVRG
ncbi:DUF397 domain-containing protein [Streptomyces mayteni]